MAIRSHVRTHTRTHSMTAEETVAFRSFVMAECERNDIKWVVVCVVCGP